MNITKKDLKTCLIIIFSCILFYISLNNISVVINVINSATDAVFPVILGAAIAFVLNVPMTKIESNLFATKELSPKLERIISIILTFALVLSLLFIIMNTIIPQLAETIQIIAKELPSAFKIAESWFYTKANYLTEFKDIANNLSIDLNEIVRELSFKLQQSATAVLTDGFSLMSGIVGGITNFVIGLVFSVYFLFGKENICTYMKKVIYAFVRERKADNILCLATLTNKTFSRFISGQCLEACILGVLFFVVMSVLRLPYAMLISVLIAFLALIPIVGAFIGCGIGFLLILMVNPVKAIMFVIMFLILQQIEGNLIYPRVVGNSVGLPSMLVLIAITIGANLMGVLGMIIFIPLFSIAYIILNGYVDKRLMEKGLTTEEIEKKICLQEQ